MNKSIFEFGDKFGVESPFGDWMGETNNNRWTPKISNISLTKSNGSKSTSRKDSFLLNIEIENESDRVEISYLKKKEVSYTKTKQGQSSKYTYSFLVEELVPAPFKEIEVEFIVKVFGIVNKALVADEKIYQAVVSIDGKVGDKAIRLPKSEVLYNLSVREAAYIANEIYKYSKYPFAETIISPKEKDDHEIEDFFLQKVIVKRDGFTAGVYKKDFGGNDVYVIAFAGTDQIVDFISNINQGVGAAFLAPHYVRAAWLAAEYKHYTNTFFVGHSLGGGLASLGALYGDKKAITFNAAGLAELTKKKFQINNKSTSKITSYIIKGEILNAILWNLKQQAEGKQIWIDSKLKKFSYDEWMNTCDGSVEHCSVLWEDYQFEWSLENHSMKQMLRALGFEE